MRQETREVAEFRAIDVRGHVRLEVTVGRPESVALTGREDAVRRLATRVSDGTLHIRNNSRDWLPIDGDARLVVRITVPQLDALTLRGGNDVHVTGFDGGATRIRIEGAANIEARGRVERLEVRVAGAGHANLVQLLANDAQVSVDGVGSVFVNVRGTLDATMNGVGAIYYAGDPSQVNSAMRGLGTIARRDAPGAPAPPPAIEPETL